MLIHRNTNLCYPDLPGKPSALQRNAKRMRAVRTYTIFFFLTYTLLNLQSKATLE